jgi:hypothetical protein
MKVEGYLRMIVAIRGLMGAAMLAIGGILFTLLVIGITKGTSLMWAWLR